MVMGQYSDGSAASTDFARGTVTPTLKELTALLSLTGYHDEQRVTAYLGHGSAPFSL